MIVMLEPVEAWSLMMLVSAVTIDSTNISEESKEAIRLWRANWNENSSEMEKLTDDINVALNAHLDAKLLRRIKSRGRYETARS
ncbi:MAG: hypothetical protein ACE5EF_00935 [Dehalococcoidia bacterium]